MEVIKAGRWLIMAIFWTCCSANKEEARVQCASNVLPCSNLGTVLHIVRSDLRQSVLDGLDNGMKSLRSDVQRYNSESQKVLLDQLKTMNSETENRKRQIISEVDELKNALLTAKDHMNGCPHPYVLRGSTCYWFADIKTDWESAKRLCQVFRGQIVEIENKDEDDFLSLQMLHHNIARTWIGLVRIPGTNKFAWSSGKSAEFTNWFVGEPSNGGSNENCAEMQSIVNKEDCSFENWNCQKSYQKGLRWNDVPCTMSFNFICKRKL